MSNQFNQLPSENGESQLAQMASNEVQLVYSDPEDYRANYANQNERSTN